jgi:hypothetical protein
MLLRTVLLAIPLLILPMTSHAAVIINEIAWMGTGNDPVLGTAEDSANEWIEIYNDGTEAADLNGWSLTSKDNDGNNGNFRIDFIQNDKNPSWNGILEPGEYALLERSDDLTLPKPAHSAFYIFTGALVDSGLTLTLTGGEPVVGGLNWEAVKGNKETKETAQRTANGWITGTPTPGEANIAEENIGNDQEQDTEVNDEAETLSNNNSNTTTRRSGSGSNNAKPKKQVIENPVLTLSILAPRTAYVNQQVSFDVIPKGVGQTVINSLKYEWNFGDIHTSASKETTHTFSYPGEYIVVAEASFAKQRAVARQEIRVLPVSFSLEKTPQGDFRLQNTAPYEVDLSGFTLRGNNSFVFPKNTILKAKGSLTVPKSRTGESSHVSLIDGGKMQIASLNSVTENKLASFAALKPAKIEPPVSAEAEMSSEISTEELASSGSKETVIQIGKTDVPERKGILVRFLNRISSLFGS